MKTAFIYFDLGKVIFEFDHSIACRSLAVETGISAEKIHQVIFESGLEEQYETGVFDESVFCQKIRERLDHEISDATLIDAISDVFSPRWDIFPVIAQLASIGFPIGILSNTCATHWEFLTKRYTLLRECFFTNVLSYEVGAMKPAEKIYRQAFEQSQQFVSCQAREVFFIDDKPENVEGARSYGFDAEVFTGVGDLHSGLVDRGVRINL